MTVAAAAFGANSAQAGPIVLKKQAQQQRTVSGEGSYYGCTGSTSVGIPFRYRSRARNLRPVWPRVGDALANDRGEPVATVTRFRRGTWTLTALGPREWDDWDYEWVCPSWRTAPAAFKLAYDVRFKVTRRDALRAMDRVLRRQFSDWKYLNVSRSGCRGSTRRWRCRQLAWVGDASYVARARVRVRMRRGWPQFLVRWHVRQLNEYCAMVLNKPRRSCIRTSRGRGRTRY
jgi:hypothetical protein